MKCPLCCNNMIINDVLDIKSFGNIQTKRVIGSCSFCDYVGTWTINYKDKTMEESNLKRYFLK